MYSDIFSLHAKLLKAIAHPRRLEIINLLRDKELPVNSIHSMLDLPQANISQHLMILRDAGVVSTRRDGKQIFYFISHNNFIIASDLIREILIDKNTNPKIAKELTIKMNDLVPLVHDPVCRMRLSPKTASFNYSYSKDTYFFCASGCLKKFKENPKNYVK